MPSVPDPFPRAHLDPHLEALELRDFNARDLAPRQDADAFPQDALTAAEIDALFVLEMQRRDHAAACPAGYRDAACEACGCGLYVPVGQGGDVLCPQCHREGEELAAGEDDDPRPPGAGAMHPDYPYFAALAARLLDDQLCEAIGIADADPSQFQLHNDEQRDAFVAALSAEVVLRLGARAAA